MFIWSFLARINPEPDLDSVVDIAIAQMLASRRKLQPNWAPENQNIRLRCAQSLSGVEDVPTQMSNATFKKAFYTAVRIKLFAYIY